MSPEGELEKMVNEVRLRVEALPEVGTYELVRDMAVLARLLEDKLVTYQLANNLLVGPCPTCGSDDRLTRMRPVAVVDQRITDGLCSDDDWHWES